MSMLPTSSIQLYQIGGGMSIYSGFATRFQEEAYDHCVDSLLYILMKRIIKFYTGESSDQPKFISLVTKLHNQMKAMEKSKYLEPKSSAAVSELVRFLEENGEKIEKNGRLETVIVDQPPEQQAVAVGKQVAEQPQPLPPKQTFWVEKNPPKVEQTPKKFNVEIQTLEPKGNCQYHRSSRNYFNQINSYPRKVSVTSALGMSKSKGFIKKQAVKDHSSNKHPDNQNQQQSQHVMRPLKVHKNRSMSHNNVEPALALAPIPTAKRRIKQNQSDSRSIQYPHNEVSDIIKDYIIKSKKNYLRGHRKEDPHIQSRQYQI